MPRIDNIEDVYVTRGKKGDFVNKSSLRFKICGICEICTICGNFIFRCSSKLVVCSQTHSRH